MFLLLIELTTVPLVLFWYVIYMFSEMGFCRIKLQNSICALYLYVCSHCYDLNIIMSPLLLTCITNENCFDVYCNRYVNYVNNYVEFLVLPFLAHVWNKVPVVKVIWSKSTKKQLYKNYVPKMYIWSSTTHHFLDGSHLVISEGVLLWQKLEWIKHFLKKQKVNRQCVERHVWLHCESDMPVKLLIWSKLKACQDPPVASLSKKPCRLS